MRLIVEGFAPTFAHPGETLLVACEASRIPMEASCGGFAGCSSCRVDLLSGAEHLDPVRLEENAFLDRPSQRLGCQASVLPGEGEIRVRLDPGL